MYNIVYETVSSKEHEITITAKEGFEDKEFDILGIAYSKWKLKKGATYAAP